MPMGSHLGEKAAHMILGDAERGRTVFAEHVCRTMPFYTGRPPVVPLVMGYYKLAGSGR